MDETIRLSELGVGQGGRVREIRAAGGIRRRLMDIGLLRGGRVECVGKSPAGDPAAYLIRGAVIAIRAQDAKKILLLREEEA
ncbi:MAG: ferrous iron transport protein A [Clostridia bacterium]|nr:ferrous iron transport protein A [Clostridia bacterium]